MADVPLALGAALEGRFARALDIEGEDPPGPRDAGADQRPRRPPRGRPLGRGRRRRHPGGGELRELDAHLTVTGWGDVPRSDIPDASADVLIGCWTSFRGPDAAEFAEAARILRPGGRLLVLHDYGRDDVSKLLGSGRSTGRGADAMGHSSVANERNPPSSRASRSAIPVGTTQRAGSDPRTGMGVRPQNLWSSLRSRSRDSRCSRLKAGGMCPTFA